MPVLWEDYLEHIMDIMSFIFNNKLRRLAIGHLKIRGDLIGSFLEKSFLNLLNSFNKTAPKN